MCHSWGIQFSDGGPEIVDMGHPRLIGLVMVLVLTACGGATPAGQSVADSESLASASRFDGFPLYSVGERFEGLPLAQVVGAANPDAEAVSFIYGTCSVPPGAEGGCATPLVVQVWDRCARTHLDYAPEVANAAISFRLRGASAYDYDSVEPGRLELELSSSTIVIFADSQRLARHAAEALTGVNVSLGSGDPLSHATPADDSQCPSAGAGTAG
jgi:hypothetical protein